MVGCNISFLFEDKVYLLVFPTYYIYIAGPKGVVKGKDGGPDSHGFCILNNVSIGASYAMNRYRDDIERVAIVDFGKILLEL